jgi:imidazolonepropionase-like amidohydrolase
MPPRALRAIAALAAVPVVMSMSPQPAVFDLAIRGVRVVHGDGRVTPSATVLVQSGRIARVDRTGAGAAAPARRVMDGAGRTLIPGLIDAHVHVEPWSPPLFLKYGVTTVRDVHNAPDVILPLAREDTPARPRIVAAGAMLDGPGSFWPNAIVVSDVASVRAAVRRQIEAGAGVIKVYTRVSASTIAAVVQEARARGVPVAAHLGRATAVQAAVAGVTSIEHLSGVADAASDDPPRLARAHDDFLAGWTAFELEWLRLRPDALDRVARALVERGVTLVPTLALHEAFSRLADEDLLRDPALADVPPEVVTRSWAPSDIMGRARWTPETLRQFGQVLPILQRFVTSYVRLGGRVVAGTDTAQQFVVPGASLHRELELYVAGGLTPAQALRSATLDAADLLGVAARAGTIDAGRDADLVLLDGDPLADIRATRRIVHVVRSGVVVR